MKYGSVTVKRLTMGIDNTKSHKQKRLCFIAAAAFLATFPCLLQTAGAQDSKYIAYGTVVDYVTRKPVSEVRVYRCTTDSAMVDSSMTDPDLNVGQLHNIYVFYPQKSGGLGLVRAEKEGYETVWVPLTIPAYKGRKFIHRLPDIVMKRRPKEVHLGGAVVKATRIKFFNRGDTLVYNADAFNLAEGSMLDALIRQLPGAELNVNGEIKVNGEKVESLLLNGEDFFKGNNQLMLDNLPSYTVKDLQIYRKRDKMSEFAGRDLGEKELVMNVRLKKEYNTGWLANIEAGSGTEARYLGRLFAMRFTDHSTLSLFANLNNLNDRRRPGENDGWTPEQMPEGRLATKMAGANYLIKDRMHRFKLNGNAVAKHSGGDNRNSTSGENFLKQGNTFRRGEDLGRTRQTTFSTYHGWEWGADAIVKQMFDLDFWITRWRNGNDIVAATFADNPFSYGTALLDSMRQVNAGALLRRSALNRTLSQTLNKGDEYSFSAQPQVGLKATGSDFLFLTGEVKLTGWTEQQFASHLYDYPKSPGTAADYRRNYIDNSRHRQEYSAGGAYFFVFPGNLIIRPQYTLTHTRWHDKTPLHRLDRLEGWSADDEHDVDELPSTTDWRMQTLDQTNSDWRHSTMTTHEFSLQEQWNTYKNTKNHWTQIRTQLTVRLVNEQMDYRRDTYDGHTGRNYTEVQPSVRVSHNWDNQQHNLNFKYYTNISQAGMVNLLALTNTADPLNIYLGNPRQKASTKHALDFSLWNNIKKTQHQWSLNATYAIRHNAHAMAYSYNRQTGVRTWRPDNVNGNWTAELSFRYSLPLDKAKRLTLSTNTEGLYNHGVDLLADSDGDIEHPARSSVKTTGLTENLKLEYKFGKSTVGLRGNAAWNGARSHREQFTTVDVWDFNYGITGTVELPLGLQLSTDLTMYCRRGYDLPSANTNDLVWNARLSKRLPKQHLTLMIDGFDILHQLSNMTQTLNTQGRIETYRNSLPSYVLLHAIYRFQMKPKHERNQR